MSFEIVVAAAATVRVIGQQQPLSNPVSPKAKYQQSLHTTIPILYTSLRRFSGHPLAIPYLTKQGRTFHSNSLVCGGVEEDGTTNNDFGRQDLHRMEYPKKMLSDGSLFNVNEE